MKAAAHRPGAAGEPIVLEVPQPEQGLCLEHIGLYATLWPKDKKLGQDGRVLYSCGPRHAVPGGRPAYPPGRR